VLAPMETPCLWIAALSSNVGLIVLLIRNKISRHKERILFEEKISYYDKKLSNCDKDRLTLSIQLEQAQKELTTTRAIMNCRGRFIARIRPLFRQMAGDRADFKGQNEVLEENLKQLCNEIDEHEAAKEHDAAADVALDVAEIIVTHA
jgi:chromosome segregation ATPase